MHTFLNDKEYNLFLKELIDNIYAILPLYEEENEFLEEYIDSLLEFEIKGAIAIYDVKSEKWYRVVVTTLSGIHRKLNSNEEITHKQVKREVFKMINSISKELKRRGE